MSPFYITEITSLTFAISIKLTIANAVKIRPHKKENLCRNKLRPRSISNGNFLIILSLGLLLPLSACRDSKNPRAQESVAPKTGDLVRAAANNDLALVKSLVANGADINETVGPIGKSITPVLAAIARGHQDVAKWLISSGAEMRLTYMKYESNDFLNAAKTKETMEQGQGAKQ